MAGKSSSGVALAVVGGAGLLWWLLSRPQGPDLIDYEAEEAARRAAEEAAAAAEAARVAEEEAARQAAEEAARQAAEEAARQQRAAEVVVRGAVALTLRPATVWADAKFDAAAVLVTSGPTAELDGVYARAYVESGGSQDYHVQMSMPFGPSAIVGRRYWVRFAARSADSSRRIRAMLSENEPPWTAYAETYPLLADSWQWSELEGVVTRATPTRVNFLIGAGVGTVEITGLQAFLLP